MLGIGRFQDELAVLARACKENGERFQWVTIKATYADVLGSYAQHRAGGRPRKDAVPLNRRRLGIYVHGDILSWVEQRTEENALFSTTDPVPHAIEAGLRLLRSAYTSDAVRSACFPFDADALWTRYERQLRVGTR